MFELVGDPRIRNLLAVGLVTVGHVILLGLAITAKISIPLNPKIAALDIEIVALEQDPPPEAPSLPDPDPEPEPPVIEAEPIPPRAAPSPIVDQQDSAPAKQTDPQPALEVLTQLDPAPLAPNTDQAPPAGTIAPDEIAQALQRLNCLKLTLHPDEACPKPDPFAVAEALQKRTDERLNPMPMIAFDQQNAAERFFSKQSSNPHMFPGMDADLFADPMPKGSYDAERIRNGLAPTWDRELRDALDPKND